MIAASQRAFVGTSAALFAASTALTIAWCRSMSAMHDMPMPGGWSMSMMWMRMPGQTWPGAATEFLAMWLVMMVAMMTPVLAPILWRYRQTVTVASRARAIILTATVGFAYFVVWTLFGALAFMAGAVLTTVEMQSPLLAHIVPAAIGTSVLIAGVLQFSAWKARQLACFRTGSDSCRLQASDACTAWRHGWRMGVHCVHCCLGLTTVLLVVGVMDLRAMAFVTAAICAERLAPGGALAARLIGVLLVVAGAGQLAHAMASW